MIPTKTHTNEKETKRNKEETHMKAIVYHTYGSPDVLKLEEVQKPVPQDDEVLVKVLAASAAAGDWHLLRGKPFLLRLMGFGLLKPKHKILGAAVAGRVEAVGRNVTQFQPGDEIFGDLTKCGFGAFAEYVCASEDALALKPANVTFEEAAAVPLAAVTALQGLRAKGQIKPGQRVLIYGAGGGVGTFAVQIAKALGAHVTAVTSTRNMDLVRSIGPDEIIDYRQEDFTRRGQRYDVVFDVAANRSFADLRRVLSPNGRVVLAGAAKKSWFGVLSRSLTSLVRSRSGLSPWLVTLLSAVTYEDLVALKELVETGKLRP